MNIEIILILFFGFCVFVPIMFFHIKKKLKRGIIFIDVLMRDYFTVMISGLLDGVDKDEFPTDLDEVLIKFYPRLPPYKEIFDYPIPELIKMVDWTIDPTKYLKKE